MLEVNGKTTQIDHVVVSNYGIFVIETKIIKAGFLAMNLMTIGLRLFINGKRIIQSNKTELWTCTGTKRAS